MKITKRQLRRIIRESLIQEAPKSLAASRQMYEAIIGTLMKSPGHIRFS
jgi:hypothetical protein